MSVCMLLFCFYLLILVWDGQFCYDDCTLGWTVKMSRKASKSASMGRFAPLFLKSQKSKNAIFPKKVFFIPRQTYFVIKSSMA